MNRSLIIISIVSLLTILFFLGDYFPVENNPVAVPSNTEIITNISSSSNRTKKQYLDEVFSQLQNENGLKSAYFQDSNALYSDLAELAMDNDERVSETALNIISLMALALWSSSMETVSDTSLVTHSATPSVQDISQSKEVKNALEQLIKAPDIDDEIRGRAIEGHSLLYPPQVDVIKEFEKLIIEGGVKKGDTLTAIFMAFTNYKSKYNYHIPTSILEAAKTLTDHPSDSVEASALRTLRENVGKPILPFLFYKLETTRNMGIANSVVMDILALDQSEDTLFTLKEIALKGTTRDKASIIEYYTSPKNIERLRYREK